jgi:hypothetical protein
MNVETLLSDGFDEFARQLAVLRNRKKLLKQELKGHYDRISAEMAEIDAAAAKLASEFEDNDGSLGVLSQAVPEGEKMEMLNKRQPNDN